MTDGAVLRPALAVVIGIAVGATLFWATLTTTPIECGSLSNGNTLFRSGLALNSPSEGKAGASFYYNFTVGFSGGEPAINHLNFQVRTAGGASVAPGNVGGVTVVSITTGTTYATYNYAGSAWSTTGNPTLGLNSTMSINFVTTASLSADELIASVTGSGACPLSGTDMVNIP